MESYVDNKFNDPSILKNTAYLDLNNRNIIITRLIQVNRLPQIDSQLTAKLYVDITIDETSLVRNNQDNDFSSYNLTKINSITLNTQAVIDNQNITEAYVDQFHQENERSRRGLGIHFSDESNDLVKNNQDNDFNDNKLTYKNSKLVNRNPISDNELVNKIYLDDELDKNTILRFHQTLQSYLNVFVGNDIYHLTKYNKIQIVDMSEIKFLNIGSDLFQKWNFKGNNKNSDSKVGNFKKSTKSYSSTSYSGATSIPPIGNSFVYIETSSNNHGHERVFVSWERSDIIQSSKIPFYYNSFSILNNNSEKSMGRFRIKFLL